MFESNLSIVISAIVTLCTGLITFFVTKKKFQDVEIESATSSNILKNLDIYQKMIDDIEERYEEKLKKRDTEIKILELSIDSLKVRMRQIEEECHKLNI